MLRYTYIACLVVCDDVKYFCIYLSQIDPYELNINIYQRGIIFIVLNCSYSFRTHLE